MDQTTVISSVNVCVETFIRILRRYRWPMNNITHGAMHGQDAHISKAQKGSVIRAAQELVCTGRHKRWLQHSLHWLSTLASHWIIRRWVYGRTCTSCGQILPDSTVYPPVWEICEITNSKGGLQYTTVERQQTSTRYMCSAQFRNLRNLEIALRILGILKLRANLEIATLRNLEIAQWQDRAISRFLTKPPLFHPTCESGTTGICYGVVP